MTTRHQDRASAIALFSQGMRNAAMASRLTGVKKSTMRKYFKNLKRGESLDEKPRSGRPRKLTSFLRRQLGQIKGRAPFESASFYAQELSRVSCGPISERSVRRALNELGYNWRLSRRRTLNSAQRAQRVEYARAHVEDNWEGVWSADESTFNLYRQGNRYWVRMKTDDAEDEPSQPRLSAAQEKVSVSIVVAISRGQKSAIGFLPRGWNATQLGNVFACQVFSSLRWSNRLGHENRLIWDNDGRHFSPPWLEVEQRLQLRPIRPWPSNSPDFNPIENVFGWMKSFVEKRDCTTETQLRQAIQDAWDAFPIDFTASLMDSIPARLQACLRKNGGRTKY